MRSTGFKPRSRHEMWAAAKRKRDSAQPEWRFIAMDKDDEILGSLGRIEGRLMGIEKLSDRTSPSDFLSAFPLCLP